MTMIRLDQLYKKSKSRSNWWNLAKTLVHTAIFWLVFLAILPYFIHWIELELQLPQYMPQLLIGWIIFSLLGCLGISSGITMSWLGSGTPLPLDGTNKLVVAGPYRYVRNPMAVAGIGQAMAVGLIYGSYFIPLYALSGALIWHFTVRPSEEKDLEESFGAAYLNYKKQVGLWWPSFKGYRK
jgi:protein-S-isoprenylcysteine O-methyltransferase Ste14